jgi:hypothetical protein
MKPPDLILDRVSLTGLRERVWLHHGYRSPANGIASDRYYYAVGTPQRAYSFTVYTGKYPPDVTWVTDRKPMATDVSVHIKSDDGTPCECLEGARCRGDGSGLVAAEQYAEWQAGKDIVVPHETVLAFLRKMHEDKTWT